MNPSQPVDLIKLCNKYLTNQFGCRVSSIQGRSPSSVINACVLNRSVVSDSLCTSLLRPWDFPGKNTGVACYFFLQDAWLPTSF